MLEPYYDHNGITIYCGDCREILPQLPNVNLVIADTPYGNNTKYGKYKDTKENLSEIVQLVVPLVKYKSERALITCGVDNIHIYPKPDWILCWYVPNSGGGCRWYGSINPGWFQ